MATKLGILCISFDLQRKVGTHRLLGETAIVKAMNLMLNNFREKTIAIAQIEGMEEQETERRKKREKSNP